MFPFPFLGYPFRYPYYKYNNDFQKNGEKLKNKNTEEQCSSVQASNMNKRFLPFFLDFKGLNDSENPVIDLFGMSLYLDDIIILCLLFILYKENSKDEMLFICLLLLLLS